MNTLRLWIAALLLGSTALAGKPFPAPPRSYVYDETNTLSASAKSTLFSTLSEEDQKNGNQILVAVFKSLDGEDPVDYTNRLFKNWNPGKKGVNNGLLIAAFLKEHKIRIEVGYGLEPVMTDAKSKRIIETQIVPAFRANRYDEGLINGVHAALVVLHPELNSTTAPDTQTDVSNQNTNNQNRPLSSFIVLIIVGIFMFLSFLSRVFNPYGRRGGFFGGWGGGGGSGWGGGGGGFSGGGGMSGGGGASGDW